MISLFVVELGHPLSSHHSWGYFTSFTSSCKWKNMKLVGMKDLNAKFSNENTFPILLLCCSPFLLKIQKIWRQINFLIVIFPSEKRVLQNKNYLRKVIPRNGSFRWTWRHILFFWLRKVTLWTDVHLRKDGLATVNMMLCIILEVGHNSWKSK